MRICELRDKEVVNICSGRRLGCVVDVEINICTGEVEAPFGCIRKIGPDIILVEIQEEKFLQKF